MCVHYLDTMNLPRTVPDFRQVSNCKLFCAARGEDMTRAGYTRGKVGWDKGRKGGRGLGATLLSFNFSATL